MMGSKEIFVGKREPKVYLRSIMKCLENNGEANVSARGQNISKACNVVMFCNREKEVKVENTSLEDVVFKTKQGKEVKVPEIKMKLKK